MIQYDLPLFSSVCTSTEYCVVAEFIVQSESCDYIKEPLQIINTWNRDWNPKFVMNDYSEAEIGALEASFRGTIVYPCDFHREQAWERWVCDKKHGLSNFLTSPVPVHGHHPSSTTTNQASHNCPQVGGSESSLRSFFFSSLTSLFLQNTYFLASFTDRRALTIVSSLMSRRGRGHEP